MIILKALLIFGLAWFLLHLAVAVIGFMRVLYPRGLISIREADYFFRPAKSGAACGSAHLASAKIVNVQPWRNGLMVRLCVGQDRKLPTPSVTSHHQTSDCPVKVLSMAVSVAKGTDRRPESAMAHPAARDLVPAPEA
jgi:hypothetical protein